ncbi:hypothetical protein M775_07200 [Neisseria gonorrhoeae MU_NG6]|nr:hypothetical protein M771_09410 [Neisseria gonorrhoeae MU_NG1]KLS84875.1 hypothetical protein M773_04900 [Neisseria gonorrhoeae MU_NG4]KLS88192.1 hypothetical protein M775_07200 [Neisseria gonorrhoeae MU_NG6]
MNRPATSPNTSLPILPPTAGLGRKYCTKPGSTGEYAAKKTKIARHPPNPCNNAPTMGPASGTTIRMMPIRANICAALRPE